MNKLNLDNLSSLDYDGKYIKPGILVDNPNPKMPLVDAILTRRTSRVYSDRVVEDDLFKKIIDLSRNAPSACNEQKWKIILIKNKKIINDLYLRGSAAFLKNSNQCFLICYNKVNDNTHWNDHIQSGAAFATTFQLLAHSFGIGSCWICHLPNKNEIKRIFNIDKVYEPICLISYGYYKGKTKFLPRKHNVEHIVMSNKFDNTNLSFISNKIINFKKLIRFLYYLLPSFFRKKIRKKSLQYEKKFYYEKFD